MIYSTSMLITLALLIIPTVFSTPTIPVLYPFFHCDLVIDLKVGLVHFILKGDLVVDSRVNGMYSGVYGDDPQNWYGKLNTSVVVHPNTDVSVTVSEVKNHKCGELHTIPKELIPLYSIPSSAVYQGTRTVEKNMCDVWHIDAPYKDVDYVNVLVKDTMILLLEALYHTGGHNVYIYVRLTNYNTVEPSADWFRPQDECKG
jgi:hypothetical protein